MEKTETKLYNIKTIGILPAVIMGIGIIISIGYLSNSLSPEFKNPWILFPFIGLTSVLLPVYLFKGEVQIKIIQKEIKMTWLRRPFLSNKKDSEFSVDQIQLWDYVMNPRGPNGFVIKLKNKKKISFVIRDFARHNEFDDFYAHFHGIVKEYNHDKKDTDKKIRNITVKFLKGKVATIIAVILPTLFILDLIFLIIDSNGEYKTILITGIVILAMSNFMFFMQFIIGRTEKE
jgi:hypothetical protein